MDGDAEALRALVLREPALARARFAFVHHQTLIQHVACAEHAVEHALRWAAAFGFRRALERVRRRALPTSARD